MPISFGSTHHVPLILPLSHRAKDLDVIYGSKYQNVSGNPCRRQVLSSSMPSCLPRDGYPTEAG